MLREAADVIEIEGAPTWAYEHGAQRDWHTVDRALRTIARRRAALDADEARWLREAEALQIWRLLGMVSALDYMERVLGYGPRAAQERLRVARALGALPELTTALAQGELPFSAVRELTRVATPATEAAWREAAIGKNLRQIEELVANHRPGDRPDDPADPEVRTHVVRFELSAETFALLRQTRSALDDEHGSHRSDDQFVATLCSTVLDGVPATESTGRAKFQIAVTVCERCRQGWQDGAGARIAINAAAVERATCDAQQIGSIDGAAPERAHQDVPPSIARLVWRRDGGRCRVPGCRSARGLELHHLIHRAHGGGHDASNLVLACSACHQAHHAGILTITGTADQLEARRSAEPRSSSGTAAAHVSSHAHVSAVANAHASVQAGAHVDAPMTPGAHVGASTKLDVAVLRTQAKDALTMLGWKPATAQTAVAAAWTELGPEPTLERLIFEALRRCHQPRT
jgi:HNH endonuclease/RuvA, C-terminal domain